MPLSPLHTLAIIAVCSGGDPLYPRLPLPLPQQGENRHQIQRLPGPGTAPGGDGHAHRLLPAQHPVLASPHGIPEAAAVAAVILLHLWKRNNLLSILGGTVIYMVLLQGVFA